MAGGVDVEVVGFGGGGFCGGEVLVLLRGGDDVAFYSNKQITSLFLNNSIQLTWIHSHFSHRNVIRPHADYYYDVPYVHLLQQAE